MKLYEILEAATFNTDSINLYIYDKEKDKYILFIEEKHQAKLGYSGKTLTHYAEYEVNELSLSCTTTALNYFNQLTINPKLDIYIYNEADKEAY